jgi:Zn-dependent peptidase ImmA (M78 family)/transcriptional regulator with XRE-family HTH domain
MGTTQPAISKVESGRAVPTLGFLERFAKAIGAPVTVTLDPGASVHADTRTARLAARPGLLEDLYVDLLRDTPDQGSGTGPSFLAAVAIARRMGQDLGVREVRRAIAEVRRSDRQAGMRLLEQHLTHFVDLAGEVGATLPGAGRSPLTAARTASTKEAAWAARELRRYLHLGGGALGDPFQALEAHVLVWRLPLAEDLEHAPSGLFYNHPAAGFCIAINSDMTLGRQVFTLAHEMAHAFFHSQDADVVVSMPRSDHDRERFADAFAGEFLVPGDELRRVAAELATFDDLGDPAAVVHLQRHFGASFGTLRVRLLQERLISRDAYDALADVSPSRLARGLGYAVHPADLGSFELNPLERFPARMLHLVRTALDRGLITKGEAAETLGTSIEEIRQLLVRPTAAGEDRHLQDDLEAAAFANRDH